jgi:serine/threonine protein kinase
LYAPAVVVSSAIAAGSTLGPYEILAKLKAGGMATLYLARRGGASGFQRHVAIKVVHDHLLSDGNFARMFVEEALLHARIQHPNVAHVEELGEHDGQYFLVMEYVHGCSLAQLMGTLARMNRALMPELATSIAVQVAAGLHGAHEVRDEKGHLLGVVHRDVSPQNVQLAYEGHVKLLDFGVAKAKNRESTSTGALKGKLRYMSPEQATRRGAVDRRSDVYALGIVLWEMLTVRPCFHADDDLAVLQMVRNPQIRKPSELSPAVPPALDAVVMKALAKRPEDRFQTAQEMRRALADAVPGAMRIDAAHIAELLAITMADAIDQLPQAVSRVIATGRSAVAPDRADEALQSMTISAPGELYVEPVSGPRTPQGAGSTPPPGAAVGSTPPPAGVAGSTPPPRAGILVIDGGAHPPIAPESPISSSGVRLQGSAAGFPSGAPSDGAIVVDGSGPRTRSQPALMPPPPPAPDRGRRARVIVAAVVVVLGLVVVGTVIALGATMPPRGRDIVATPLESTSGAATATGGEAAAPPTESGSAAEAGSAVAGRPAPGSASGPGSEPGSVAPRSASGLGPGSAAAPGAGSASAPGVGAGTGSGAGTGTGSGSGAGSGSGTATGAASGTAAPPLEAGSERSPSRGSGASRPTTRTTTPRRAPRPDPDPAAVRASVPLADEF